MMKRNTLRCLLLSLLLALVLSLSACNLEDVLPMLGQGAVGGSGGYQTTPDTADGDEDGTDNENPPVPDGDHVDKNDDGVCDDCRVSVMVELAFFAMNDLHGKFDDTQNQPGVDELTTYLKDARAAYDGMILLSSGDMWQGSSESNLTRGQILTEWMNELDFAAMTLGNHEYDWGEEAIAANAALAEFPLLAINVYDRDTDARAAYCSPSVMVDLDYVQIGIIGAIGDCYSSISGEMSGGVYFKTGHELTALVKAEAIRLREAGADLIVYSLHDGYDESRMSGTLSDGDLRGYYDPSLSDGYIDLVFEGHTHQKYALVDSEGVYHLQNGGENRGISRVTVAYNVANGNHRVQNATVIASSVYDDEEPDPLVDKLLEQYRDQVSLGSQVLGQNGRYMNSDALKALVARLYYEAGMEAWGDEYDIVLGGGFLSVRSPYDLQAGKVVYSDLQSLLPFDNALVLCSIKGEDLLSKFIHTSNRNYVNYYGDYGQSVKDNIDPRKTYYIVVDTYTSTYAPNRLTEIKRYDSAVFARDLVAEYIRGGGLA